MREEKIEQNELPKLLLEELYKMIILDSAIQVELYYELITSNILAYLLSKFYVKRH